MSYERKQLVFNVYSQLQDNDENSKVIIDALLQLFDPSYHPSVTRKYLNANQAIDQFISCLKLADSQSNEVDFANFLDYFKILSLYYQNDSEFELFIRQLFHIPHSRSSLTRRVVVTHSDNTQEVFELNNALDGVDLNDKKAIIKKLGSLGIRNIVDVQV